MKAANELSEDLWLQFECDQNHLKRMEVWWHNIFNGFLCENGQNNLTTAFVFFSFFFYNL